MRTSLQRKIEKYISLNPERSEQGKMCLDLLECFSGNRAFMRDLFDDGHSTASAFVLNPEQTKVLLMHHIKLGKWQQFGGYADGEYDLVNVAKRELEEEAGIQEKDIYIDSDILEIDIQQIPVLKGEPEHLHYDIRFLVKVSEDVEFIKQDREVHYIAWFSIDTVLQDNGREDFQDSMKEVLTSLRRV